MHHLPQTGSSIYETCSKHASGQSDIMANNSLHALADRCYQVRRHSSSFCSVVHYCCYRLSFRLPLVFLSVLSLASFSFISHFGLSKMMFLKASFLACAALLLSSSFAAPLSPKKSNITNFVYPDLLEATTEELAEGLRKGLFTSVDLVNVRFIPSSSGCCPSTGFVLMLKE